MVLTKCFSLFGLSISFSKNIFVFKCGCLSGSNNLNLHLEMAFLKKIYSMQKFQKSLSHSPKHCGHLRETKTSNFFSQSLMQLWKVNSNPDKSKLLLKYWMLYSAIKGMCSISANGSIESPQTVHYWAFLKSHHQNGWPRCERVTWKNCKRRNTLEVTQK